MTQRTHSAAPNLDDHSWALLTESLEAFESSWTSAPCPDVGAFLPAVEPTLQKHILTELIKVDMDYRWRNGQRRPLESYLQQWTQLDPDASAELLRSECLIRFFEGEPATDEEINSRFPDLADSIDLTALQMEARRDGAERCGTSTTTTRAPSATDTQYDLQLICGEPFGRYQILELLGTGNMGSVYRAYDPNLDRQVALKIPQSSDPALLDRFLREARLAARIRHPNVCPIYDADRVHGASYLTMALIDGQTLAENLKSRRWRPRETAEFVAQVARALQVVHDQGIVHRDVKPSNVMLEGQHQPLLMDFGLAGGHWRDGTENPHMATAIGGSPGASKTGPMIGTPAYMPPEQVHGRSIDQRGDIYSLGVVLYQMLTGRLPFQGSIDEVLHQVVHEEPAKPRDVEASIPDRLEQICLRAMAKDREDRYQTAQDLAASLERYVGASRQRIRRPLYIAAATVCAMLLATVIFFKTGNGVLELDLPAGAVVVIDGTTTPPEAGRLQVSLNVGKHRLQVFLDGSTIADQSITIRWRGDHVTGHIAPSPAARILGWNRTGYDLCNSYHFPPTRRRTSDRLERLAWNPAQPTESIVCVRTGDVKGDGRLEIVVRAGRHVITYDDQANELWRQTPLDDAEIELKAGCRDLAAFIELVDFDQDGSMEVLTLASANPPEKWIRSSEVRAVVYDSKGSHIDCISVFGKVAEAHGVPDGCFDYNGDGLPDLVLSLAVWQHPHGVFVYDVASQEELFSTLFADHPGVAGVGDVDGDGALDLYLLQEWDSHVDEPVGDYDAEHCYATLFNLNGERRWVHAYRDSLDGCLADLDADGVLDIILFNSTSQGGSLYVLDPRTGEPRATYTGFGNTLYRRWSVADINGDGYPDVLFGDGEQVLAVAFNAKLEPKLLHHVEMPDTRVAVTTDLNGDGKIDVVAFQHSSVIVLDHQLREIDRYVASGAIRDVVVSDVNQDGINELILLAGPDDHASVEIIRFSPDQLHRSNVLLPTNVSREFLRALRGSDIDAAIALTLHEQRDALRETLENEDYAGLPTNVCMNIFHQKQDRARVTARGGGEELFELELVRRGGRWWVSRIRRQSKVVKEEGRAKRVG